MFDVPADKGVTRDITRTPGANERDAVWSPDGKYIAYISDRTGETEVWLQPSEGGEPIQLTENNDTYIRQLMWSPNSKKVLYTDRKNRIVEVDVNSKSKKLSCKTLKKSFIQSITLRQPMDYLYQIGQEQHVCGLCIPSYFGQRISCNREMV